MMTIVPFLKYKTLPSQTIVQENIRLGHVKEDIDALIYVFTPILYMTKPGVPKPPFLDPSVIQHLIDKPGSLNLLHLLGWFSNNRGDYVYLNANSSDEISQREKITNEFCQFYNELKVRKDNDITTIENAHSIITTVPFSSYCVIPAEKIIRENIRLDHIKEDLDSLIHALTPLLYVTKTGVPKPPFLDPSIIQQLIDKNGTLNLLSDLGCIPNNRGEYIFVDTNTPHDKSLRESISNEFRQFYDELKKMKNSNTDVMEYYLNHAK